MGEGKIDFQPHFQPPTSKSSIRHRTQQRAVWLRLDLANPTAPHLHCVDDGKFPREGSSRSAHGFSIVMFLPMIGRRFVLDDFMLLCTVAFNPLGHELTHAHGAFCTR